MNRKTSIIVSITGIVIIILALLGLTYGYYVSKITGNETAKSVEVITGDSSVRFTDLSESDINEIIEPGYTVTKSFTVENTGNISATYSIYFVDVYNDFIRTEDITYTLYRIDNDSTFPTNYEGCIESPTDEKSCKIVVNNAEFPTSVAMIKENETITTPGDTFRYDLVITYINQPDINQNVDQGHTFRGSINLRASMDDLDNPFSEGTLAYNIINNAKSTETVTYNKTVYIEPGLQDGTNYTIPAEQINNENERILTYTEDDYGTSYYYRGNIQDNYVNFAGMCWRVVRIAGDGSIKIILEDQYTTCNDTEDTDGEETDDYAYTGDWAIGYGNYGYEIKNVDSDSYNKYIMNYLEPVTRNTSSMVKAFYDFQTTKLADYTEKLKSGDWCLSDKAYKQNGTLYTPLNEYDYSSEFYYDSDVRLYVNTEKTPTLKCTGTILNKFLNVSSENTIITSESPMYVATLTADEMVYAGGKSGDSSLYLYLINENLKSSNLYFWSMSPKKYKNYISDNLITDMVYALSYNGILIGGAVLNEADVVFRPAVILKSNSVIIGGIGTISSPYIIG